MSYYNYSTTMENLDGDYTEEGIVYAKDYKDAEKKLKYFYYKDKVKKMDVWFNTTSDILILNGK